jgi:ATP-dependent Clp protease protease subunit
MLKRTLYNTITKRSLQYFSEEVDYDKNHNIYFRCDVTNTSVMKLTRIVQEMNNSKENIKAPIKIHMTSNGGDAEYGLLGYDLLKLSKRAIYTYCEGNVMSAATLLFLAGKTRFITIHSKMLIHQISCEIEGSYSNMKDCMLNNDMLMKNFKNIYLQETKIKENILDDILRRDICIGSKDCIKFGFAHKICKNHSKY